VNTCPRVATLLGGRPETWKRTAAIQSHIVMIPAFVGAQADSGRRGESAAQPSMVQTFGRRRFTRLYVGTSGRCRFAARLEARIHGPTTAGRTRVALVAVQRVVVSSFRSIRDLFQDPTLWQATVRVPTACARRRARGARVRGPGTRRRGRSVRVLHTAFNLAEHRYRRQTRLGGLTRASSL
jgi:hypothetical protein